MKKEVSVLMPFYNPGFFFEDAIKSVLAQDHPSFELILVNNNSDYESVELASKYEISNPDIKMVYEPQKGIANALNLGLKYCSGDFIARMDADDYCLNKRLTVQSEFLKNNDQFDVVSGLVKMESEFAGNEGMRDYVDQINELTSEDQIYHYRFVDAPFAHPSVMFRKSLIGKYGYYSTDLIPEDYEMWLRWYANDVRMAKVPFEVIRWRDHENRASRIDPRYSKEAFNTVRLGYLNEHLKKVNSHSKPLFVWGAGKLAFKKAAELDMQIAGFIDVSSKESVGGFDVINYLDIPPPGEIFILSLVSNRGKHKEISDYLIEKGYTPEMDFIIGA